MSSYDKKFHEKTKNEEPRALAYHFVQPNYLSKDGINLNLKYLMALPSQ